VANIFFPEAFSSALRNSVCSMAQSKLNSIGKNWLAKNSIGVSFGIGTDLTNDIGLKAMNIVIKMTEALPDSEPWTNVIKLSDEPMKHTGEKQSIALTKEILHIPG
jgi:nicotinic acid phosphoribosyltransferase